MKAMTAFLSGTEIAMITAVIMFWIGMIVLLIRFLKRRKNNNPR